MQGMGLGMGRPLACICLSTNFRRAHDRGCGQRFLKDGPDLYMAQ